MTPEEYVNSIEWVFYLERVRSVLLASIMCWNYGPQLQQYSGFHFKHQLIRRDGDRELLHLSSEELAAADRHFGKLLANEDPRIWDWFKREEEIRAQVEAGVAFGSVSEMVTFFRDACLFNTILPYRMFSALEESHSEKIREKLEEIRNTSLYPAFHANVALPMLEKFANEQGIPPHLAPRCTDQELLSGSIPPIEELERREHCYFYLLGDEITFYYDSIPELEKGTESVDQLTGTVAFAADTVEGTAKIVNTIEDIKKMQEGDIMISINSNPSLMPAINKAAALVTNEGGALCHAAVVSRELKIPCIIGTKNATRVFQDGERVSVDTREGSITRVSALPSSENS